MKRALITVITTLIIMTTLGCGSGKTPSSKPKNNLTPADAVTAHFKAVCDGDVDTIWSLMSQANKNELIKSSENSEIEAKQMLKIGASMMKWDRIEIEQVTIHDDNATVIATIFKGAEDKKGFTSPCRLVKENGKWLNAPSENK